MRKKHCEKLKNINSKQIIILSLLLVMSEIIKAEIFLFIITSYLAMMIFRYGVIKKSIKINLYLLIIFTIGFIIGMVQLSINSYNIRDFIRDIFMFLTPIIFIMYGIYTRFNRKNNINSIYISIINAAIIIEIRHLILLLFSINNILNGLSIRGIGGNGSYITMIAIIIILFYKDDVTLNYLGTKIRRYLTAIFLITLFVCYLSRTHLIILLVSVLINIFTSKKVKFKHVMSLIIYTLIIIAIGITVIPENTLSQFIDKFANSIQEVSSNLERWNAVNINNNWRGYEVYRVKELIKESTSLEILLGFGFGKRVDLNINMYLGNQKFSSIPILHNGYYYILLKCGLIGICIYILFILNIVFRKYKIIYNDFESKLLSIVGVGILFATYVVTGIYTKGSIFVFCLIIGASFYDDKKIVIQKSKIK